MLLFSEIAGTVIAALLGTGIVEEGSCGPMVLLTALVDQNNAKEIALQVNMASSPIGTGDGFWSRTSLATAANKIKTTSWQLCG